MDTAALFQLMSVPPPWLTQEYFKAALQTYQKDTSLEVNCEHISHRVKIVFSFVLVFVTTILISINMERNVFVGDNVAQG